MAGPTRPAATIEEFLFNLHQVLVAAPSPLAVDGVKDAYSKQLGHKCAIERWLVVGEGGLSGTFKRIPHIVTLYQANGVACIKSALAATATKETLIEADQSFRRELQKKNQAAKLAKAGAPPGTVPAAAAKKAAAPPPVAKATEPANAPDIAKKAGGPTRPPATIEDFLWNMYSVLDAYGGPLPIDQLKDAYSKHLGHKCAIERFLVVGDVGLAGTLKRIPHVVTVTTENGVSNLTPTLPAGSSREQLVQADQDYRKQLQQKNLAAKALAQGTGAKAAPPAASAKPSAPVPAPAAGQARPAEGGGEPDAKRAKAGDADTLSRMLIQGVVRVLQHRAKEGKGTLLSSDLAEEFKALWKVPFNLQSAGYTEVNTFLTAWPNKVELTGNVVTLAKKVAGEKGKAESEVGVKAPPPAPKVAAAATEPPATAKKAAPVVAPPLAAVPAIPAKAKAPPPATTTSEPAAADEPDAKKAKTTDMDTLSRMLVQGVVRVLQSRAKDLKGDLLVSDLPDEFKILWKVPFNLQSAGYSDVHAFLKAWPNKIEVTSSPEGDVVILAKKAAEKANAEAPKAPVVTAAKSAAPAAAKSVAPTLPAKPAAPVPPAASPTSPVSSSIELDAPIPSTGPEIRKELARAAHEVGRLADRQRVLIEALGRIA